MRVATSSSTRRLGGAAALPVGAWAQQPQPLRRVGLFLAFVENDPETSARVAALLERLQQLGWVEGRNVRFDFRWIGPVFDIDRYRAHAADLIAAAPDVVLAGSGAAARILQQASRTLPIVFTQTIDPVGDGLVTSLARPGGNATGIAAYEFGMAVKWLELLKEVAPRVVRVAVFREPTIVGSGQFGAMQGVAASMGVELSPIDPSDDNEIERAVAAFARQPNGGLIATGSGVARDHRNAIIALAARHRLPAVYPFRAFVADGGLICYGIDQVDPWRRAAEYVDRILKGEKPADLPVQLPTRFEIVLNLKTAKALGLDVPTSVLLRAGEVIE
jgi:putative ABC transport system substrate-binding protein